MSVKGRLSRKKSDIYRILIKHPFLDALQYAVRNRKNKEKCRRMAGRNGLDMQCRSYGNINKDKCIYYIRFGDKTHGFFALFRILLKYLAYADRFGFYPVVEWSREIPYAEEETICGTLNPFEYYFEQPMGISVKEVKQSYNVFQSEEIHVTDFFLDKEIEGGEDGYLMSEIFLSKLSEIAGKYIRLNQWTEQYMQKEIACLLRDKKTVGVHVRGSDYKSGYNNHPTIVPVEEYLQEAKKLFSSGRYEQVFLATDDDQALQLFKNTFGEKLVYFRDVVRTSGKTSVAFSEASREKHKYLLGLEVLRDMLSLTACDGLVAGISQVSNCARIIKKSRNIEYEDIKILYKGINHTKNNFVR